MIGGEDFFMDSWALCLLGKRFMAARKEDILSWLSHDRNTGNYEKATPRSNLMKPKSHED